jgi:hypothetical protein
MCITQNRLYETRTCHSGFARCVWVPCLGCLVDILCPPNGISSIATTAAVTVFVPISRVDTANHLLLRHVELLPVLCVVDLNEVLGFNDSCSSERPAGTATASKKQFENRDQPLCPEPGSYYDLSVAAVVVDHQG